jgi:hypothetical protein
MVYMRGFILLAHNYYSIGLKSVIIISFKHFLYTQYGGLYRVVGSSRSPVGVGGSLESDSISRSRSRSVSWDDPDFQAQWTSELNFVSEAIAEVYGDNILVGQSVARVPD